MAIWWVTLRPMAGFFLKIEQKQPKSPGFAAKKALRSKNKLWCENFFGKTLDKPKNGTTFARLFEETGFVA